MDLSHIFSVAVDIMTAALATIGGLKVIARYTPFTWDDAILDTAESILRKVLPFLPKK